MGQAAPKPQDDSPHSGHATPSTGFGQVLDRNISKLLAMRTRAEREKGLQERIADRITGFAGSMTFVYLHAVLFGGWIAVNLGLLPIPPFDPSFTVLAMVASVEAIFLSTFVLISQNRMAASDEKRSELDLQISLLAEHEVTQIVRMLDAISAHLGVEIGRDSHLEEAERDVDPATVLEVIEAREERRDRGPDARGPSKRTAGAG